MENVRVRFAPSPTGPLHMGGVRTALFNYLYAKKHGGTFILRIEDTDQTRYVANAEKYIIESLQWCGIMFNEGPNVNEKFGPYRQSERKDIYKKYADNLIASGQAYYAFDTAEELDILRKKAEENKTVFIYNNVSRETLNNSINLSKEEVATKISNGTAYVIRFKTPKDQKLIMDDMIRGEIVIDTNTLDDKILFKSDGMPTYHLANIVDDHLMQISHVIRGEEWLPSMPLHILLYEAFGWIAPKFAHLPLILKPVGQGKLSKRDGDKLGFPVFPINYINEDTKEITKGYREEGYFKEAFVNMLALLGWNPGTEQELFSLEELCNTFSIERIAKSGAKFNPEKAKWFNQKYMQTNDESEIATTFKTLYEEKLKAFDLSYIEEVVKQNKERATFVKDFWDLCNYYFEEPTKYDEKVIKKQWKENTPIILQTIASIIETNNNFDLQEIESSVKESIATNGWAIGNVMQTLRLAIVGEVKGPHLFDIMKLIGKEKTIQRIKNSIKIIKPLN